MSVRTTLAWSTIVLGLATWQNSTHHDASSAKTTSDPQFAQQQSVVTRLSGVSGAEFDRASMEEMVKDHKHDVAMLQSKAHQGKDQDLRAWVSRKLPRTTANTAGVTVAHK